MEKNTLIAIGLSAAVLIGFYFVQSTLYPPPPPGSVPAKTAAAPVPADQALVPAAPAAAILPAAGGDSGEALIEGTHTITTDKVRAVFTNRGGDIISYELLGHRDGDHGVQMTDNVTQTNRAFAVAFGGSGGGVIQELFRTERDGNSSITFSRRFVLQTAGGTEKEFTLTKRYSFAPDDYMFKLDIVVTSADGTGLAFDNAAYTLCSSPQIGPYYDPKKDRYERRLFMAWNGAKKKTDTVKQGQIKDFSNPWNWTGVEGKYFTALVVPAAPQDMLNITYSSAVEVDNYANSQIFIRRAAIQSPTATDTYYVYLGPLAESDLKVYNTEGGNPWRVSALRLNESMTSTGVLSFLEAALKWCMELLYRVFPNWGITIVILTVILKIALFPLTRKSSQATSRMQELQPQMQEIQEKYKGSPEKLNVEIAKFYKEAGYNPMSGCLPLLVQFPIIIAMFNLFNNYFEFRGASFIPGWIPDLSVGDSVLAFPFTIPFLGWDRLRLLPIIYVISQLLFGKVTPSAGGGTNAGQMKMMMYGMPIFFFFIFYNAPSGLLIYWTTSNVLQLFQQMLINKMMGKKKGAGGTKKAAVFVPRKKKR
ncbi:MAG: membrane protein insertase YidC [Spirochaetaceae bacterium]|jgi:YidC/Oxa1 family membrane protein insertase|nr:membrane protein insertase YidC [Spirochaetaceae bacterium]